MAHRWNRRHSDFHVNPTRRSLSAYYSVLSSPWEGFQELMVELEPRYNIPSRTTISAHIVQLFDTTRENLKTILKNKALALTTNIWIYSNKLHIILNSFKFNFSKNLQLYDVMQHSALSCDRRARPSTKDFSHLLLFIFTHVLSVFKLLFHLFWSTLVHLWVAGKC